MVSKAEIRSTLIEHGKFKIMIMNAPNDDNAAQYILELKNVGVTDVVRTCEPTYSTASFEKAGITVHEMTFPDGAAPPDDKIKEWNELVRRRYKPKNSSDSGVVAVHCVAGLGRAPVMAAVALVEITGMSSMDAIEKIREFRRGAINAKQFQFLRDYKPASKPGCCMIQ
mmetsp:Transcript_27230/g.53233  ORF Transcript_27230/g.53233 Transcript_27230/m.53233 type:complete len:169 (+) Transcript_27230:185-691(+)|eukprot:CAMPEP_0172708392 /NCGR_PEP_ID=MMETSP1074-20121228/50831_1 /TAXON_ID=2916 /ORGANISM="Ceratium fusus, Strain PA161109" /LENGTH=168 /DNA_ID=CAMNT_0013531343 /DNA_START=183 /DNA_END=689 /DNA_ORIENTATION=+